MCPFGYPFSSLNAPHAALAAEVIGPEPRARECVQRGEKSSMA